MKDRARKRKDRWNDLPSAMRDFATQAGPTGRVPTSFCSGRPVPGKATSLGFFMN